jgi:hypothetical protein
MKECSKASFKRCATSVTKKRQKRRTSNGGAVKTGKLLHADSIRVHSKEQCDGKYCCFHKPSKHAMVTWDMYIRFDKFNLVERLCPKHRIGHPDPDSMAYLKRMGISGLDMHGCCGCEMAASL